MFKIVPSQRAWWPVVWRGLTEEGEVIENRIEMRFNIHTVDEAVEMLRQVAEAIDRARLATDQGEQVAASALYAQAVTRLVDDWRGVAAENGEPLKWSEESLRQLVNLQGVFVAIQEGYRACLSAGQDIRQGN